MNKTFSSEILQNKKKFEKISEKGGRVEMLNMFIFYLALFYKDVLDIKVFVPKVKTKKDIMVPCNLYVYSVWLITSKGVSYQLNASKVALKLYMEMYIFI